MVKVISIKIVEMERTRLRELTSEKFLYSKLNLAKMKKRKIPDSGNCASIILKLLVRFAFYQGKKVQLRNVNK